MIPYKQLSLADIFDSDTPKFLTLWENHINDASKITRFTQDFLDDLKIVFEREHLRSLTPFIA